MLVTLDEIKTHLGLQTSEHDDFLETNIIEISDAVRGYCGRVFNSASYTQTFYQDEFDTPQKELYLFHYPLTTLTSVVIDGDDVTSRVRTHKPKAKVLSFPELFFGRFEDEVVITYTAGFASIPTPIKSVVKSLVTERFNKNQAGIDLNFGRDVQQISIPGAINVAFDYTLQANSRKTAFGMIIGDYSNVLDHYRSERALVGEIGTNYVD